MLRSNEETIVREPQFAGTWYPAGADELAAAVESFLDQDSPLSHERPVGLIAPHAGLPFSGQVAGAAYRQVRGHEFNRVIVLAFHHKLSVGFQGIALPDLPLAYRTPLGPVAVDQVFCRALLTHDGFHQRTGIDRNEHSLEMHLPFLQLVAKEAELVPLFVGRLTLIELGHAAEVLASLMDDQTLIVASSDFTHYGPRYGYQVAGGEEDVRQLLLSRAHSSADPVARCDLNAFRTFLDETEDTICGHGPIALLINTLARRGGVWGHRLALSFSGLVSGNWEDCVTYQSFLFSERTGLAQRDRDWLMKVARQSVAQRLTGQCTVGVNMPGFPAEGTLHEPASCFVTLRTNGDLRGCVGQVEAFEPLFRSVARNAAGACRDPRSPRKLKHAELDDVDIEISVLANLRPIEAPRDISLGRHGVYLVWGERTGVLLPHVAVRNEWSARDFLEEVCVKTGLPRESWRSDQVKLFRFDVLTVD
ncbi:MAG: AmmeMemoRadiSam system protein B [Planctomycetota bacterium]